MYINAFGFIGFRYQSLHGLPPLMCDLLCRDYFSFIFLIVRYIEKNSDRKTSCLRSKEKNKEGRKISFK